MGRSNKTPIFVVPDKYHGDMMKENEYIITDSMLMIWRAGCIRASVENPYPIECNGCKYDNRERRGCDFDDDAVQKMFQSRSLTEIIKELERLKKVAAESGYTEFPQSALINSISYDDVIELIEKGVKKS